MSKSRIDRLGRRLRDAAATEEELRELSEYRETFAAAYRRVFAVMRERLGSEPTGRPAKSTAAIIDKLRRESIRLSQIQDIAGLRLVVPDIAAQDEAVERLAGSFERLTVVDRRSRPSHGYRAVHVIVEIEGASVEIQVRTILQHRWAELSEKLSDLMDAAIKYGGGHPEVRELLSRSSGLIAGIESSERRLAEFDHVLQLLGNPPVLEQEVDTAQRSLRVISAAARATFEAMLRDFRRLAGER